MTRQQILGVLLFVGLVAFTLWLSWPPTISPRPVDYLCADGDTVTVLAIDTGRVELLRPAIAEVPLQRHPSDVGTTYQDSASGILFWARGPFAVLHQEDTLLHHGCTAASAELTPCAGTDRTRTVADGASLSRTHPTFGSHGPTSTIRDFSMSARITSRPP